MERLKRLVLLGIGAALLLVLIQSLVSWQQKNAALGIKISLPKFEGSQENILGAVSKILGKKVDSEELEGEPIAEPVKSIESQTQALIESVKKLPEDQLEAIKVQLFKEFCESLLEKEENGSQNSSESAQDS